MKSRKRRDPPLFTPEDKHLFRIPDDMTRMHAVRDYFMPRLGKLLDEACEDIREVYGIDPTEVSTITRHPWPRSFARLSQQSESMAHLASYGLCAKRGLRYETDTEKREILGVDLTFHAEPAGLSVRLQSRLRSGSNGILHAIYSRAPGLVLGMLETLGPTMTIDISAKDPITTLPRYMKQILPSDPEFDFMGRWVSYHQAATERRGLIAQFTLLYPLYRAIILEALGNPPDTAGLRRLHRLWAERSLTDEDPNEELEEDSRSVDFSSIVAAEYANRVPLGKRWQIFERDGWRCVSCGHSAKDAGVTLHIDHIQPRSKGGGDEPENLQTLCRDCNLGKSNRSNRNLRSQARR